MIHANCNLPARRLAALGATRGSIHRLDRLLAECTGAWLVSKGRITEDQNREATTMTQVMTEYERLARAEAAVIECSTAEELLRRVRGSSGA